jgi:hypothetical protein
MWIDPLHFSDGSAQLDRFAPVVFRSEGVMRCDRNRAGEYKTYRRTDWSKSRWHWDLLAP